MAAVDDAAAGIRIPIRVRPLHRQDLPTLDWTGSATHRRAVEARLARIATGHAAYEAAVGPADVPLGLIAIAFADAHGVGTISMLEVHPALRSCGIGTALIGVGEAMAAERGLAVAELAVEVGNERARALYVRLGYHEDRREPAEWDVEGPDGAVVRYRTTLAVLRRRLE